MMVNILIVEDDVDLNQLLGDVLNREGYRTEQVYDGDTALSRIRHQAYDLIILDLMVPGVDGYEILRTIRQQQHTPVLIVSAKTEEVDKVVGLRLGADDYITKPFSISEFLARVQALLRRYLEFNHTPNTRGKLTHGTLTLDPDTYRCTVGQRTVALTAKEFAILKLLISHPGKVFTKAQIFEAVWGNDFLADENTVMVHIRRLRKKVEEDPSNPTIIQTVWGIGYKMGEGEAP